MSRRSGNAKRTHGVAASSPDTGLALFNTTTCEPSDPTRPASMSSAEDSPVRTCRTLGRALASRVSALVCGSSSLASCATFDPASSSWRTSQRSLLGGWTPFSGAFPKRGMMRSGSIFAPPTWERLIDASDSSSSDGSANWNTPTVEDAGRAGSPEWAERWAMGESPPTTQQRLRTQALMNWPTPKASDVTRGDCPSERRRKTPCLPSQVKTINWPTPTREDGESARRGKNARGGASLTEIAAPRAWPTPGASKACNDTTLTCSGDGRKRPNKLGWAVALDGGPARTVTDASTTMGGSLNPDFVEELMGFPKGWTRTNGPPAPAKRSAPTKRRG